MALNAIEMPVIDWINVPDCPVQRDTESHFRTALRDYLGEYDPIHRFVYAAVKDGKIICKLDGHTRAFGWNTGELPMPPEGTVVVLMRHVSSMAEAEKVYDKIDNKKPSKGAKDTIFGAARKNKYRFKSALLRRCKFKHYLSIAEFGTCRNIKTDDIYTLIRKWKNELIELDKLNLSSFYTIFVGTALVAIRRDGIDVAGRFFKDLDEDKGVKDGRGEEAIHALSSHFALRRASGSHAGWDNVNDLSARAWFAYSHWRNGNKMVNGLTICIPDETNPFPTGSGKNIVFKGIVKTIEERQAAAKQRLMMNLNGRKKR